MYLIISAEEIETLKIRLVKEMLEYIHYQKVKQQWLDHRDNQLSLSTGHNSETPKSIIGTISIRLAGACPWGGGGGVVRPQHTVGDTVL